MQNIQIKLLQEALGPLTVTVSSTSAQEIELNYSELKSTILWKRAPITDQVIGSFFSNCKNVKTEGFKITFHAPTKNMNSFNAFCGQILKFTSLIFGENPEQLILWGEWHQGCPSGFDESLPNAGKKLLEELYQDDFIVKEKKGFVIDLSQSHGSYMVSIPPEKLTIIDAAAQIASLALGFNDKQSESMLLRDELYNPNLNLDSWDATQAFTKILKEESGLPYLNFLNSGSEAIEASIRSCQTQHPNRKKIIAFEGSFHGRTLLSLHATHNPDKRKPFEIFHNLVDFISFPEDKTPQIKAPEPKGWLELWENPKNSNFAEKISQFQKTDDCLLLEEIKSLLSIKTSIEKETPLCLITEPMQCEGGDRYASNRFFRALRLLTQAYDVSLIMDEVQCGFGLGGPFFWFKFFELKDSKGNSLYPDSVCGGKKSQVGYCLSKFKQEIPIECSGASLYRGYLQAIAIKNCDPTHFEKKSKPYLKALQDTLGKNLIQNPRAQAMAYAFDLPDAEIPKSLIAERFKNGILFYPAGDKTLRFRIMASTTERELAQAFIGLYRCFEACAKTGKIKDPVAPLSKFAERGPEILKTLINEKPGTVYHSHWGKHQLPLNEKEFLEFPFKDWHRLFSKLFRHAPILLKRANDFGLTLDKISSLSKSDLWSMYLKNTEMTYLDLLFHASRRFGFNVMRIDEKEAQAIIPSVQKLEEALYEKERRDDPNLFAKFAKNPKTIYLCAFDEEKNVLGYTVTCPISDFHHVALVSHDEKRNDPNVYYSVNVSTHPQVQGQGLGVRLKCEQIIEALSQKAQTIRSRNRYPEAKNMSSLNRGLSAVVIDQNNKDYGGTGTAIYQSLNLEMNPDLHLFFNSKNGSLRNKTSLANFVTPHYINNLLLIKELLPSGLKHIYLASGRAESVDKAIKLLKTKRPEANIALSFTHDYFGCTTAVSRSLGGEKNSPLDYFKWPKIDPTLDALKKTLNEIDTKKVLGFFVEPIQEKTGKKREVSFLKSVIEICHEKQIPVFFSETASHFYKYQPDLYLAASHPELKPDGSFMYIQGQLGLICVNRTYFLDKALAMISTWDGDDHSLNLYRDKILGHLN